MAAAKVKEYRRLPGRRFFSISLGRYSLWQGKDHLLYVINRAYSEEYKRFYRSDIQAIVVRKTATWFYVNAIFGGLLLFSLVFLVDGLYKRPEQEWQWIASLFFVVPLCLIFFWNLLQGQTCDTYLITAAHQERIMSLHRLHVAQRVVRMLRPWIEAEQGSVNSEQLANLQQAATVPAAPAVAAAAARPAEPPSTYDGTFHLAMFLLLFADAFLYAVQLLSRSLFVVGAHVLVYLAVGALVVVCLLKGREGKVPYRLSIVTWSTLVYLWLVTAVVSTWGTLFAITHPDIVNPMELFREMLSRSPLESKAETAAYAAGYFAAIGLGLSGLVLSLRFRRTRSAH